MLYMDHVISLLCEPNAGPLRAPKWYKHKAGVSFGFGRKLVSFKSKDSSGESSEVNSTVFCSLLIFELP